MKNAENFFGIYLKMFFRPRDAFDRLNNSKRELWYGLLALLIPAAIYTVFYILAYNAGGAPSKFKPWLALPIEKYFFYGIFLSIPGYFCSGVVASALMYMLLKLSNKTVTYDGVMGIVGFTAGVATWSTLLHDFSDAVLSFLGIITMAEYEKVLNSGGFWDYLYKVLMILYLVWFIILYYKGIRSVSNVNRMYAIFTAVVSFISFQTILLIFIR